MSIKKVVLTGYTPAPSKLSLGTYDSYGTEQVQVVPGPEWAGLTLTATFVTPTGSTRIVVPDSGVFDVPQEATTQALSIANPGMIVFTGVSGEVQRISTNVLYTVSNHAAVESSNPPPTPSEWAQYVAELQGVVNDAVPPTNAAGLVLHSGGTGAPNYWAAGGGSGGTTDYNQLLNKPQINGVELTGDKSWEDLGLPDVAALAQAAAQSAQEAADAAGAASSASTAATDSASAAQSSAAAAATKAEESESSAQSALQGAASATQSATAAGQSAAAAEGSAQQAAGSASSAADAANQAEAAAGKIPDPSGTVNAYLASNAEGTGYTLIPTSQIVQEVLAALPNGDEVSY